MHPGAAQRAATREIRVLIEQLPVTALRDWLDDTQRAAPLIVDVREPQEYQINRVPGSILIPLGDLPKRYVELDPNANIVTQCKSGMRSAKAQEFLRSKGFTQVRNLTGGVLGWIDQVDPSQPKY